MRLTTMKSAPYYSTYIDLGYIVNTVVDRNKKNHYNVCSTTLDAEVPDPQAS
jgi:hypothetical protein